MQADNRNFKNEAVSTRVLLFPDIPLRASLGTIARWSCAACRQFNERSSGGINRTIGRECLCSFVSRLNLLFFNVTLLK